MTNDLINGLFEALGGCFIWLSIRDLRIKQHVAGVSPWHVGFFMSWGWWNIWYYPSLGLVIVTLNTIWLAMLVYYARQSAGRLS